MAVSLPYFTPSDLPPSLSPRPTVTTTALVPGNSAACQSSFFSIVTGEFSPPTGAAAAFTAGGGGLSAFLSPTDCAALAAIPPSVSAEWSAYVVRAEEWVPRRQDDISSRLPQCPNFTTFLSRGGVAARQTCTAAGPTAASSSTAGPTITAPPTVPTTSRNISLPTPTLSPNSTTSLPPNTSGRVGVSVSLALGVLIVLFAGTML